jgi:hypothetical protein
VPQGGDATAAEAAASAAGVTSSLLARLLGEAIAPAATGAAGAALDLLHTSAARANDYGSLFASRERFPEVRGGWGEVAPAVHVLATPAARVCVVACQRVNCLCATVHALNLWNTVRLLLPGCNPPAAQVFERAQAVADAEAHLHGLLPLLARTAGVPAGRLAYVSIQNQAGTAALLCLAHSSALA